MTAFGVLNASKFSAEMPIFSIYEMDPWQTETRNELIPIQL